MIVLEFSMTDSDVGELSEFIARPFPEELCDDMPCWAPYAHLTFVIDGEFICSNQREPQRLPVLDFAICLQTILHTISIGETKRLDLLLHGPLCDLSLVDAHTVLIKAARYRESGPLSVTCALPDIMNASDCYTRKLVDRIRNNFPEYFHKMDQNGETNGLMPNSKKMFQQLLVSELP